MKYICILLISLMLTIGANAVSISTHGLSDNMLPRHTEICTYMGVPMAEEEDDDIEDDDYTEDDNYNPSPCDLIEFPEAIVDYVVVPNQNIGNTYTPEIEYITHDRMTIGEII